MNEVDYNLPEDDNLASVLLDRLENLQTSSSHRSAQYLEAIQDCIDITTMVLSGPKPFPYLKNER